MSLARSSNWFTWWNAYHTFIYISFYLLLYEPTSLFRFCFFYLTPSIQLNVIYSASVLSVRSHAIGDQHETTSLNRPIKPYIFQSLSLPSSLDKLVRFSLEQHKIRGPNKHTCFCCCCFCFLAHYLAALFFFLFEEGISKKLCKKKKKLNSVEEKHQTAFSNAFGRFCNPDTRHTHRTQSALLLCEEILSFASFIQKPVVK